METFRCSQRLAKCLTLSSYANQAANADILCGLRKRLLFASRQAPLQCQTPDRTYKFSAGACPSGQSASEGPGKLATSGVTKPRTSRDPSKLCKNSQARMLATLQGSYCQSPCQDPVKSIFRIILIRVLISRNETQCPVVLCKARESTKVNSEMFNRLSQSLWDFVMSVFQHCAERVVRAQWAISTGNERVKVQPQLP